MQTLDRKVYSQLNIMARDRGVSIQEFIRAIVIPYYMKDSEELEGSPMLRRRRQYSTP